MYFLYVLCCLCTIFEITSGNCQFNLETPLEGKTPIVLQSGIILHSNNRFGDVILQNNETIQFLCSGPHNYLLDRRIGPLVEATCINNQFRLHSFPNNTYNFASLTCRKPPQAQAQEIGTCHLHAKKIQIGFQITLSKYLPLIELCYHPTEIITYWTWHVLKTSTYSCQTSDTTNFKKNFFVGGNPDAVYGLYPNIQKGHLSPEYDFFTGPEKRMTYYYVNSAPQLKQFNEGNWRDLEAVIRTAANIYGKLLYIYTGTAKTVQYLNNTIPMQLYFWKALIDPSTNSGVAFLGINSGRKESCPCHEVRCDTINWLRGTFVPRMSNVTKGRIYCCTVQSLKDVVDMHLPDLLESFNGALLTNM